MNPKKIGNTLRLLRGEKTLELVASETGLTASALSNYEQGIRIPRDESKVKLASYYGMTVEEIFFAK